MVCIKKFENIFVAFYIFCLEHATSKNDANLTGVQETRNIPILLKNESWFPVPYHAILLTIPLFFVSAVCV
jgi:hypothetical protein